MNTKVQEVANEIAGIQYVGGDSILVVNDTDVTLVSPGTEPNTVIVESLDQAAGEWVQE